MGGNFAILNRCPRKWADLEGQGRARFCNVCQTHVHAIAEYSPKEWNQIWRESNGRVCGLLCGETLGPPRTRRALLIGALLTAFSPLFGATGRVRFRVLDPDGVVIPRVSISLMDSNERVVRTLETNESGEVGWTDLPPGDSLFLVSLPGWPTKRVNITFRNAKEVKAEVHFSLPVIGDVIEVKGKRKKHNGWIVY